MTAFCPGRVTMKFVEGCSSEGDGWFAYPERETNLLTALMSGAVLGPYPTKDAAERAAEIADMHVVVNDCPICGGDESICARTPAAPKKKG